MTTKLDRLKALNATLLECKTECVNDADEWQFYDAIAKQVNADIIEEERRLGYMVVYPIVDGHAVDELFSGTEEQCQSYVDILLEGHPEMKGNIIITNI